MLKSHETITERAAIVALQRVRAFEQKRKFKDAFKYLSEYFWENLESTPFVRNTLDESTKAEIWLRCGVVLSWYSNFKQIRDWNLRSRDWITKSHLIYSQLGNFNKITECEMELGINYWREGDFSNAEAWLNSADNRKNLVSNEIRTRTTSNLLAILIEQRNFERAKNIINETENSIIDLVEDVIKIPFYINSARIFQESGDLDESILRYEKVIDLSINSDNLIDLSIAENNLGNIYCQLGEIETALLYSKRAEQRLISLNDLGRQASCLESRARIHFEEGDLVEALNCIDGSIRLLESGEEYSTLAESVWTKVEILFQLGENIEGYRLFTKLIHLAENKISESLALEFVKRFDLIVQPITNYSFDNEMILFERKYLEYFLKKNNFKISTTAQTIGISHQRLRDLLRSSHPKLNILVPEKTRSCQKKEQKTYNLDNYQIKLPPDINPILVFRSDNNRLAFLGINSKALAVVIEPDLSKNLPIVVRNIETGEIFSGFNDKFSENLGFVALLAEDSEPILIESGLAQIFGTIVGFCKFNEKTDSFEYHKLKL